MLESLTEHQLLVFWTQLLVLFGIARLLGYLLGRVGLPTVIGHLGAGVLLGPSVFARVWPDGFHWFLPEGDPEHGGAIQSGALLAVAWVGIALLLIITGFETDLGLITRLGRAAATVSIASLVVPLVFGFGVGLLLPKVFSVVPADGEGEIKSWVFALFIGTALGVSSLAVVAKILSELGLMRRDFGQITVAAGMANDLVGWLMLGLLAALAQPVFKVSGVISTVVLLLVFIALALTLGQRVVDNMLRIVRREGENVGGAITVALLVALSFAVVTQWIGVEGVLGAFIAGVVLSRSRFQQEAVIEHLEVITAAFFAPIFFATAGLRVDLGLLFEGSNWIWALLVLVVAIVAKFAGAMIGARMAGLSTREGVALGGGLNARGALEIVIATVGLELAVFSDTAYTTIVMVPIVTSLFAAVVLRASVKGWEGTDSEIERLKREEALSRSLVVRASRVLLPSRGGPASILAAQIVQLAWPKEAPVTVLSVGASDEDSMEPIRNVLYEREVDQKVTGVNDPAEEILRESKLGYGAIAIGTRGMRADGRVLPPLHDQVMFESEIPLVVVRRPPLTDERPLPGFFTRAIVPVSGSTASRAAQELAFNLSEELGTQIVLHHSLGAEAPSSAPGSFSPLGSLRRITQAEIADTPADKMVSKAQDEAHDLGIVARADIRQGPVGSTIVATTRDNNADLVVLGATVKLLDDRPFLGGVAEYVLEHSQATVVVVIVPAAQEKRQ